MESACEYAALYHQSSALKIVLVVKCISYVIGIVSLLLSMKNTGVRWLVHPNAKVIFSAHLFWALWMPIGYLISGGYDLYRLMSEFSNPCDYAEPAGIGLILRIIPTLALNAQTVTMLCMLLERIFATMFPIWYEKVTSPIIGILMVVLTCGLTFWADIYFIFLGFDWNSDSRMALSGVATPQNKEYVKINTAVSLGIEIFTVFSFLFAYFYNLKKKDELKGHPSEMGHRYQLSENVCITRRLLPCFIVHGLCSSTTFMGVLQVILIPMDQVTKMIVREAVFQPHMYSIIMPIILACQKKRTHRTGVDNHQSTAERYFQDLDRIFNKEYP